MAEYINKIYLPTSLGSMTEDTFYLSSSFWDGICKACYPESCFNPPYPLSRTLNNRWLQCAKISMCACSDSVNVGCQSRDFSPSELLFTYPHTPHPTPVNLHSNPVTSVTYHINTVCYSLNTCRVPCHFAINPPQFGIALSKRQNFLK